MSIILKTNDEKFYNLNIRHAKESTLLKDMIEQLLENNEGHKNNESSEMPIPLPNVDGHTMELVIKYITSPIMYRHVPSHDIDKEVPDKVIITEWENDYLESMNYKERMEVFEAANYLHIQQLYDLSCQFEANILDKMYFAGEIDKIRERLNIPDTATEEEKIQRAKEVEWCTDAVCQFVE